MKLATTARLPKKTSAKVDDADNPAWTEDMLGAPVHAGIRQSRIDPREPRASITLSLSDAEVPQGIDGASLTRSTRRPDGNRRDAINR